MKPHEESITVQMAEALDDPEVQLAKAIIEGNLEAVKNSIKTIKEKNSNVLQSINSSKIHHIIPSKSFQAISLKDNSFQCPYTQFPLIKNTVKP